MTLPSAVASQAFSLPATERFALAQQLLDSIDEAEAARLDNEFVAELARRRQEMLSGQEIVADWRAALAGIEASLDKEDTIEGASP